MADEGRNRTENGVGAEPAQVPRGGAGRRARAGGGEPAAHGNAVRTADEASQEGTSQERVHGAVFVREEVFMES